MYLYRKVICKKTEKLFLIFLIILSTNILYSQERASTDRKWILSFNFSGNSTYRTAKKMTPDFKPKYGPSYRHVDYQVPKYGWHTSILIAQKFFKDSYLQTGIIIDNQGYKTTVIADTFYSKDGSVATIDEYNIKYNFRFIGFPLRIIQRVNLTSKAFLSFELGGTYYFGGTWSEQWNKGPKQRYSFGFANFYSVNCGIGFGYLFKKMHLSVRPNYNYFINWNEYDRTRYDKIYYKLNLYSYGLELGLNYPLGKK